jgi:hypothetical protein
VSPSTSSGPKATSRRAPAPGRSSGRGSRMTHCTPVAGDSRRAGALHHPRQSRPLLACHQRSCRHTACPYIGPRRSRSWQAYPRSTSFPPHSGEGSVHVARGVRLARSDHGCSTTQTRRASILCRHTGWIEAHETFRRQRRPTARCCMAIPPFRKARSGTARGSWSTHFPRTRAATCGGSGALLRGNANGELAAQR